MNTHVTSVLAEASLMWISARGLGLAAWLTSSLTVAFGLLTAQPAIRARISPGSRLTAHRMLAFGAVVLAMGHVLVLLPDPYAKLTWVDVFVPGLAEQMALPTALGTVAFVVLLLVTGVSLLRLPLGSNTWRAVHATAFAVWPLATAHYVLAGTDATRAWSVVMLVSTSALLAALLIARGWTPALQWVRVRGRHPVDAAFTTDASERVGAAGLAPPPASGPASSPGLRAVAPQDLRVIRTRANTADALTIEFDRPAGFEFAPGQFLTLRVPLDQGYAARCYSLSSTPDDGVLAITVKRVPGGAASTWLVEHASPGMHLTALPPSGTFRLDAGQDPLLMCAAGSGITPLYSMISHELTHGQRHISLLYANTDSGNVIFGDELAELARRYPERFELIVWLECTRGRPTTDDLTALFAAHSGAQMYLCGPAGFAAVVRTSATQAGWPDDRVHFEEFASLGSDPFELLTRRTTDAATSSTTLQVSVAGERVVVPWDDDLSLVEALLVAGVDAPRSCMAGRCATCVCTVVSGEVETRATVRNGEAVLACQTRPVGGLVRVDF